MHGNEVTAAACRASVCLTLLCVCPAPTRAGVLDPSEYPGFDEDEGGLMANVDAEVRGGSSGGVAARGRGFCF